MIRADYGRAILAEEHENYNSGFHISGGGRNKNRKRALPTRGSALKGSRNLPSRD
jgi:hypothetical protein